MSSPVIYISKRCDHCFKLIKMLHQRPHLRGHYKIVSIDDSPFPQSVKSVPCMIIDNQVVNATDLFNYILSSDNKSNNQQQQQQQQPQQSSIFNNFQQPNSLVNFKPPVQQQSNTFSSFKPLVQNQQTFGNVNKDENKNVWGTWGNNNNGWGT